MIAHGTHKQPSGMGRDSCPVVSCESRYRNEILYQPLVMRIVTMNGSQIPKYFCTKSVKQTYYSEIIRDRQHVSSPVLLNGFRYLVLSSVLTAAHLHLCSCMCIYKTCPHIRLSTSTKKREAVSFSETLLLTHNSTRYQKP